jgi:hypothetical protein
MPGGGAVLVDDGRAAAVSVCFVRLGSKRSLLTIDATIARASAAPPCPPDSRLLRLPPSPPPRGTSVTLPGSRASIGGNDRAQVRTICTPRPSTITASAMLSTSQRRISRCPRRRA